MTRHAIHRGIWALGLLAASLGLVGCGATILPTIHSESERLAVAERMAAKGDYSSAIELLKTYIAANAGSANVDRAIYLLGQCYLRTKDWGSASVEFDRLLRDYPESDSSGSAAFRLGEAYWGQARPPDFDQEYTLKALDQWQRYLRGYPGHWLNAEAGRRVAAGRERLATKLVMTGELYLKLKLPGPARAYFELASQTYADTPLLADALLGLARCDARSGHREEAIARLRDIEARWAGQPVAGRAARERSRIERAAPRAGNRSERSPNPRSQAERS